MLRLMLITSNPAGAAAAVAAGVDRIFVDLEVLGKRARQGHRDTVISDHSLDDVASVRAAVPSAVVLVRTNPWHAGSPAEVEGAIAAGADLLMLPMWHGAEEVRSFCAAAAGRAGVIPLVETPGAVRSAPQVAAIPGVVELYVGLNDLHLALGMRFMFELLATTMVSDVAKAAQDHGLPFGFGGVARMHEGLVTGRLVLGEHLRLGSSSVILSRTFLRREEGEDDAAALRAFAAAIGDLRKTELELRARCPDDIERDRQALVTAIDGAVARA